MRITAAGLARLGPVSPNRPPLDPTAQNARHQLAQELAKPQYQAARPSGIDEFIAQVEKWFFSLFNLKGGPVPFGPNLILLVVVAVVIIGVVVAFLVFGLPRLNRRSAAAGALFGDDDERDSIALRQAAERAAAAHAFDLAIEEIFRSIARGLAERAILTTFPGTTAHNFAVEAGRAFPDLGHELTKAANSFDAVRYLGESGSESDWRALSALEARLRAARPVLELADA
jgi:hypothetical protein